MRCWLLVLTACNTTVTSHGVLASKTLSGTGAVTIAAIGATLPQSEFDIGDSPVVLGDASFKFWFGDAAASNAIISCSPLPWSSIAIGQAMPIASLSGAECFVDVTTPDCDRGASLAAGSLTALAMLDRDGNGTLLLELDGSGDATIVNVNCNPMQLGLHFEVTLTGTAMFHDVESQPHEGGWPFGG